MITRLPLFIFCCFLLQPLQAQVYQSAALFSGKSYDYGLRVEVDNEGNLFTLGCFHDSLNLGGNIYAPRNGAQWEHFLVKSDPSGNVIWSEVFGKSAIHEIQKAITVDDSNNIILSVSTNYIGDSLYSFPAGFNNALVKYNSNGTLLWVKPYQSLGFNALDTDDLGNIYATGGMNSFFSFDSITVNGPTAGGGGSSVGFNTITVKITPSGVPLWAKMIGVSNSAPHNSSCRPYDILVDTAGAVYTYGEFSIEMFFDPPTYTDGIVAPGTGSAPDALFLVKYNQFGNREWGRLINTPYIYRNTGESLALGSDGNIYLSGSCATSLDLGNGIQFSSLGYSSFLAVISPTGVAQDAYVLNKVGRVRYNDVQVLSPGVAYVFVNVEDTFSFAGQSFSILGSQNFITKIDLNDSINPEKWVVQIDGSGWFGDMAYDKLNGVIYFTNRVDGAYNWGPFSGTAIRGDAFVVGIVDTQGTIKNTVRGRVLFDKTVNCSFDSLDIPLKNQILKLTPGSRYASTNAAGNFSFYGVDTAAYNIELLPNVADNHISSVCPPNSILPLDLDTLGVDTTGFDFYLDGALCPILRTEVNMLAKRLCSTSSNDINVCNDGLIAAYNVLVKVDMPEYLTPVSASQTYTFDNDSNLLFVIDTVPAFDCLQIRIIDNVNCSVNDLGFTACVSAEVEAITCLPTDSNWTGAEVAVTVICQEGSDATIYTIYNVGNGDMADSTEYRVYLDAALVHMGMVKLNAGDSISFVILSNGKTVRIEADQVPYHPTATLALTYYEGCGKTIPIPVSLRFIVQFPLEDGALITDISCEEIVGSYDPNDKQTIPKGFTSSHFIRPSTRLNYLIRFQNTGTAAAYRVEIIDTLSEYLDLSTFRLAGSSHDMQLSISGNNNAVLKFLFDPIILPDSTSDPLGSQGYVAFSVVPYDTLIPTSVITNFAEIYFDANPPVRTNTEFHEIWTGTITGNADITECTGAPEALAMTDTTLCELDTIELFANNVDGEWSLISGNGVLYNESSSSALILYSDTGNYQLVWATQLCLDSNQDTVNIYNLSIEKPILIHNNDSLTALGSYTTYQWYFNDSLLSFTSPSIPVSETGTYKAIGYNAFCSSIVSDSFNIDISGIAENVYDISILPNPSESILTLRVNNLNNEVHTIKLFNTMGKLMATYFMDNGSKELQMDVSTFAQGIYLYVIASQTNEPIAKGTLIKK